jgi:anaerobic selenocysteine-containing dehydrogenase
MPDEIESGNLRAMINLSGNLLTCMPDSERFNAALGKLEVLATIEIFDNAIANFSTHALPAKDQLERSDVSLAVDPGFSEIGAQFTPAVLRPRGDVKSYWWILTELGKRMEIDYFPGVDPRTMTDDDVVDLIAQGGRVPIDTSGDANYTFAQDRFFGWILKLADQMGGFRLAPRPLVEQMTTMEPPAPLMLIARRMPRHLNSRRFGDKGDNPTIYVSPDDAETHSLENGDFTRVRSRHGEITGRIIIDSTLSQGVLNVPHGWEGEYNVNRLTSVSELDPITGMATASNLPVELIKVTSAKPGHAVATA